MDTPRRSRSRSVTRYLVAVAVLVTVGVAFAVTHLKAAVPTVARSLLWIDSVQRGPMLREVRGPGVLVPEHIRFITAVVPARVDRIVVRPGTPVHADTVIVELSNPDVKLQALEAERQAAAARAELVNLEANSDNQRFAQESAIASIETTLGEAKRRADADSKLAKKGYLSELELGQSNASAHEQSEKLAAERRRLDAMGRGRLAQVSAQRAQVARLDAIASFRRQQFAELTVKAGVEGVLQDLALDAGQWVTAGTVLAKVTEPGGLKAEIRVPEVLAKDVIAGQTAKVDTRNGVVAGRVTRVYPGVVAATVKVEIALEQGAPNGARAEQNVEGTIEIERIADTTFVGRPATGEPGSTVWLFRLTPTGDEAIRVPVHLGRVSARTVEVISGLNVGDRVVLSDSSSQWSNAPRVRLQ